MPSSASPSSVRISFWEWLQAALLATNLGWTTLCLGGYRPETMVVTSLLTGVLLAVHLLQRAWKSNALAPTRFVLQAGATRWDRRVPPLQQLHPAGWSMLPFLAYAAANVAWITPVRWLGWHDWLFWAQMIAVFWVVLNDLRSPAVRHGLEIFLLGLAVVAVGLGCYQRFVRPDWLMLGRVQAAQFLGRASGPFGIPNSLAAFLLLMLPPVAVLAMRRGASAIFQRLGFGVATAILAVGLMLTVSRGAWLGLLLALMAWPLIGSGRSWLWRMSVAAMVLGGALAIGATLYFSSPQVRERLDRLVDDMGERTRPIMWRGAGQIFREHPVVGGGAGSYNVLFERYRPENFRDDPQWAHNEYLNTLSDYGAVGFILFFGVGGYIVWRCFRGDRTAPADPVHRMGWTIDDPAVRQATGVGLLAFAFQLFVDFHFKIPALGMIFATLAGGLVQRTWPVPPEGARGRCRERLAFGAASAAVLMATIWFVVPHYRGETMRYGIRRKMDGYALHPASLEFERELLAHAKTEFARATELDPSNAQAWSDRAYATVAWSHHEPAQAMELGREAEGYARRALAEAKLIPEFWLRLGTALDLQGRWVEAGAAFVEALRLAPANAPMWYYQAYHLSLKPVTKPLAEAAIATCLRLDPGNREAEALRQRLVSR